MREILFRAKKVTDKEWVLGGYVNALQTDRGAGFDKDTHFIMGHNGLANVVDSETVCQYTGLTGKNGRKIFEGDILRFVNHINNNEWLCAVEFLAGSFICRYIYKDGKLGEYNHFTSWHEKVKWEVIGNIFDNPELIGDQP